MSHETYTETVTSSSNTSNQEDDILEIDAGSGRRLVEVQIGIETGAGSDVTAQVFDGQAQVAPVDDPTDISGELVRLPCHAELAPGDTLQLRHSNSSSTNRDISVTATVVDDD